MGAHGQHLLRCWRLLLSVWLLAFACGSAPCAAGDAAYAAPVVWVASSRAVAAYAPIRADARPSARPLGSAALAARSLAQDFTGRAPAPHVARFITARFITAHAACFDGRTLYRDHCRFLR